MFSKINLTRAEFELLCKFKKGAKESDFRIDSWKPVLRNDVKNTIKNFKDSKLITEADLLTRIDYSYKLPEIKSFLKSHGQKVSGKKSELAILASKFPNEQFVKDITKQKIWMLSENGEPVVQKYLDFKTNEREVSEKESYHLLENGEYRKAVLCVADYESKQVFARGMGIDWNKYDPTYDAKALEIVSTHPPKAIKNIGKEYKPLFLAGAMKFIWGSSDIRKWIPENHQTDFESAFTIFVRLSNERNLVDYRDNSYFITGVMILGVGDSCEECKKLHGKVFNLNDVPELPYEQCTDEHGCRCMYSPQTRFSNI